MVDRRQRSLPVFRELPELPKTPKVDEVRRRLGGRIGTGPRVGEVVHLTVGDDHVPGVILADSGERCDVWVGSGTVRRVQTEAARGFQGEVPSAIRAIASDITIFASLAEGQRVVATLDGEHVEVTLAEKCRYGALVVRDDDVLMGVGFRMLTPAGGTPC
jgi:hypothetical protein